jgi:ribonuclease J
MAENITDPSRIAQAVRRTIGKWVGETYRRQPRIVPTVIEV